MHAHDGGVLLADTPVIGGRFPGLPPLDSTYGALYMGTVFSIIFYGFTVYQTHRYFILYPKDLPYVKWLVVTIFILETFHSILSISACYHRFITNFLNPASLAEGHWSTRLLVPATGLTIFVCQVFYAHRVWIVGPRFRWLVGLSVVGMLLLIAFTIVGTVESFILSLEDFKHVAWLISSMYGSAVFADIVLSGTLITVLFRSRTGFRRTDSTIEVLILYTINTGLIMTIFGLLCFIFAMILPGNLIYIGTSLPGTKLYANSVLAVLNSRKALSNRMLERMEMGTFEAYVGTAQRRRRRRSRRSDDDGEEGEGEGGDIPPQLSLLTRSNVDDTHISFATRTGTSSGTGGTGTDGSNATSSGGISSTAGESSGSSRVFVEKEKHPTMDGLMRDTDAEKEKGRSSSLPASRPAG